VSKKISSIFICLFLVFGNINIYAQTVPQTNLCKKKEVVIAFFNGIKNTPFEAAISRDELKKFYGETTPSGENISYELLYNETVSFYSDIMEVFEQRLIEQAKETREVYEERYEIFYYMLHNGSWYDILYNLDDAFKNMVNAFAKDVSARIDASLASLAHNSPTAVNYAEHKARIDNWIVEGKKLLFVAHSQGNLFANAAYDYTKSKIGEQAVKVVHVAPPTSSLRGVYILADKDIVINLLRGTPNYTDIIPGYFSRPAGKNNKKDFNGHGFVEIYINAKLDISSSVKTHIDNALSSIVATAGAQSGFFTVTLTWNGRGDVDLHIFEPNSTWVYYANKTGHSGYLDVDNTYADGPEHYYTSCDTNKLIEGIYAIKIANYSGADGRTATVQLASYDDGVLGTQTRVLGEATWENPAYHIFHVMVSSATGKYRAVLVQ
jgi:hypothetical protein